MPEATTRRGRQLRREVEIEWTRLSFHYGLTFEEVARMPRWARRIYFRALDELLAEQQIRNVEAASFAHMKKADQKSMARRLERKASGGRRRQVVSKPKTEQELREGLAGLGVAVTEVGKDA